MAEQSGLQGMVEKVDRGEQSGLHRLVEVDSAKQRVLQGLAGKVDREDQLVVQRLAQHSVQGAEGDEGQGLEHRVQGCCWGPATLATRLAR